MNLIFKKIPKPKRRVQHVVWADEMMKVSSLSLCCVVSLPRHWVVVVGGKVVVGVKVVLLGHQLTVVST